METHPLAGQRAPKEILIDPERLTRAYFEIEPDPSNAAERVCFGTSGHRGCSLQGSFNRAHILAISQAVCDYRKHRGIAGPLFLGIDTHALSRPALATTIEVFAANSVDTFIQRDQGYTPTPAISRAILTYNRGRFSGLADGVVITPSHNPPTDGGFKYNPPNGGPAGTEVTSWIENRANELLRRGNSEVKMLPYERAIRSDRIHFTDFVAPYVNELSNVVDLDVIREVGVRLAVNPMGGSNLAYWQAIADDYRLRIDVVNTEIDPTFGFMCLDKDGKIRMDCSSPYAMAGLVALKDRYDIAFGNDPDSDRHGIVTRSMGLMNPNHFLAVAIEYLFSNRSGWKRDLAIGKTVVSSSMIDRVAARLGRRLSEVPVGFKWFVDGLLSGELGFGGEESAGASFLRMDGRAWTTDKDGMILCLLAAEILARTGKDPGEHYRRLTEEFGTPSFERIDVPASAQLRDALKRISPDQVRSDTLAGERILQKLTHAPGNGAPIGGLKIVTRNGWFAARPSGTEDVYKIYMESFLGEEHLRRIRADAQDVIDQALELG